MLFNYKAVDSTNLQREGTVEAPTVDAAISAVQKRGYTLVSIDEVNPKGGFAGLLNVEFTFFQSISNKDIVIFSGFKKGYIDATTETYALDMSVPTAVWKRMDDMPFQGLLWKALKPLPVPLTFRTILCSIVWWTIARLKSGPCPDPSKSRKISY